jgi:hypothetical protein
MRLAQPILILATLLLGPVLPAATAHAEARSQKPHSAHAPRRDCVPINGRFGYYGNPWCDTGSYRLEDVEFRERTRAARERRPRN